MKVSKVFYPDKFSEVYLVSFLSCLSFSFFFLFLQICSKYISIVILLLWRVEKVYSKSCLEAAERKVKKSPFSLSSFATTNLVVLPHAFIFKLRTLWRLFSARAQIVWAWAALKTTKLSRSETFFSLFAQRFHLKTQALWRLWWACAQIVWVWVALKGISKPWLCSSFASCFHL